MARLSMNICGLSIYPSIYLSVYLAVSLSVCLSVRLSVCLPVCLSVGLLISSPSLKKRSTKHKAAKISSPCMFLSVPYI